MYAAIHFTGGLHETEWEFYDERTFNAHFCTSAKDTVVTQCCVTENPILEKAPLWMWHIPLSENGAQ